jgi:hypothetical protein
MKTTFLMLSLLLFINIHLAAQKDETVSVKAGTRVVDNFPVRIRYNYPQFSTGEILFKNGSSSSKRLNYNFLVDEVEFIQSGDTLAFLKKKDISRIVIEQDTFLYDNGYLKIISGGPVKVGLRQYYKLQEILKKDGYGTASAASATNSYSVLPSDDYYRKQIVDKEMIFQKTREYYLSVSTSDFVLFRKKAVMKLFPEKSDEIQQYLKSNKVDFDSESDLLRLAGFLKRL